MTTDRTIMFYDGGCPLCRREVDHYRRLDRHQRVQWQDITQDIELLTRHGITREAAMASLHVCDPQGQLHRGAYAFAALWQELPYYRWLARFLKSLRLLPLLDWAYQRFARWRLRRRCDDGLCTTDNRKGR